MSKPIQFEKTLANELLERLRNGETLRQICFDPNMPTSTTVWRWTNGENGAERSWANLYARARLDQADSFAHDIIMIADNVDDIARLAAERAVENLPIDATYSEIKRAEFYAKQRSIESARMSIDARKFLASKMNPGRYGDKVVIDLNTTEDETFKLELKQIPTAQLVAIKELRKQLELIQSNSQEPEKEVLELTEGEDFTCSP